MTLVGLTGEADDVGSVRRIAVACYAAALASRPDRTKIQGLDLVMDDSCVSIDHREDFWCFVYVIR